MVRQSELEMLEASSAENKRTKCARLAQKMCQVHSMKGNNYLSITVRLERLFERTAL